ncbi:MAG TPA: YbhB/YbcL family Raf kinase inhibitor-like protein [Patescibacteria group bacterium]|nr:YbhB/YbcL family Raf kinase inhibitor-like protein [Patescibacteria group bacterium]
MIIQSPVVRPNGPIPTRYTCDGKNINPSLNISQAPANTKSLVLIVDDPDAPAGTWVHWTMWNIPPDTICIKEGSIPTGAVEGVTSFGRPGYGGPCPHSGTHRYFFKLYALDALLALSQAAKVADIEKAMSGHIIEQSELMGVYARQ